MCLQTWRLTTTLTLFTSVFAPMGNVQAQTPTPVNQAQAATTAGKPSPAPALSAKFQSATQAAQAQNVGERASAVVTLREIAADTSASQALRQEALFRIAQARELDRAQPALILDAYRQALVAQPDGSLTTAIELRIAALLAGQNDTRGARQILEPLAEHLETFPREVQADVLTQLSAVLAKDDDASGSAACTLRMIEKGLAANEALETQLYLKACTALAVAGDLANGLAIAERLLKRTPPLAYVNYKTVLLWLVQQNLSASNPDAAVSALRAALDQQNDLPLADALDLRIRIATILLVNKGDPAGAERECKTVLQTVKALPAASWGSLKNVCDSAAIALATLYLDTGRSDALVSQTLETIDDEYPNVTTVSAMIALAHPAAATNAVVADGLIDALRRCMGRNLANSSLTDACQQAIVELLLAQPDKRDEALQEARVFYRTVQPSKLLNATDLVVHAFKQVDRNLSRANAFLRYQCHGVAGSDGKVGTDDDLKDPLEALSAIPADAPRNQTFDKVLAGIGHNWLARARLLAYMDRSHEAFHALVQAFACCPPKETAMQPIADELVTLVVRVTRDTELGKQLIDYIMNGAAGADGKAGTNDDVGDVFEQVAKRLSVTHDEPRQPAHGATTEPPAAH